MIPLLGKSTVADRKYAFQTLANPSSINSIALDIFDERVYYVDYYTKTIASVDYNGNDWRTILHSDTLITSTSSLAIFEEKLYWSDSEQDSVFVMNKFNGTEVRKVIVLFLPFHLTHRFTTFSDQ